MALTDRRSYPRWNAQGVTAWLFVDSSEPQRCSVIDVSRNGVLLESSTTLVPGMEIELALARTYRSNLTRLFRRWAQVVRCTPNNTFAVIFVDPSLDVRLSRRGS